jgi:hypothetical protein
MKVTRQCGACALIPRTAASTSPSLGRTRLQRVQDLFPYSYGEIPRAGSSAKIGGSAVPPEAFFRQSVVVPPWVRRHIHQKVVAMDIVAM